MNQKDIQILLADDDQDDCDLFRDALDELSAQAKLVTVHDGEQLMRYLTGKKQVLPDMIFLDLNMPRKNGFEALSEIKLNENLNHLPVIIFSTSFDVDIVQLLYKKNAQYYIRKPNEFGKLKKVLQEALALITDKKDKPAFENFVLQS